MNDVMKPVRTILLAASCSALAGLLERHEHSLPEPSRLAHRRGKMNRIPLVIAFLVPLAFGGCQPSNTTGKADHPDGSSKTSQAEPQRAAPAEGAGSGADRDPARLYCEEHQCYEDLCIYCHEEFREAGRLWCKEHNRYEDRCFECHPGLRDQQRAYCEKHFLYVDECFMCRPELKAAAETGARVAPAAQPFMCREHGVPETECGICHPELLGKLAPGSGLKVRFASKDAAAKAGIECALPTMGPMADAVECYGEVSFNQNRLARVAAPLGGALQGVLVDLGDRVAEGQVLASIWSAAIGEAVARAVLAEQTEARERRLREGGISSERDFQAADAARHAARQQLKTLGFDDHQIEALATQSVESAMLELRAPFQGEVVERDAVQGSLVAGGDYLFTIADRSTMWAMLDVPEKALTDLRVGQRVEIRADALPGQAFAGTLTWIAPDVDERTRMARARAEVSDPEGKLRSRMFVHARILTGNTESSVLVPRDALQRIDDRDFVFVKRADDLYEARRVRLGAAFDGRVAIVEGLRADEPVVVAGGFVAKSQALISRLGAGCVDE